MKKKTPSLLRMTLIQIAFDSKLQSERVCGKNLPHYGHRLMCPTSNRKSLVSTKPVCQHLFVRTDVAIDRRIVSGIQLMLMSPVSLPSNRHRMMFHLHTIRWFDDPPHTRKHFSTFDRTHSTRCRCSWPISKCIQN